MKFKSIVAVLGAAAFLQLSTVSALLAEPAADKPKAATEQALENAIRKLTYVAAHTPPAKTGAAGSAAPIKVSLPPVTEKTTQAPAAAAAKPADPAPAAKQASGVQMADNEDVITLNLMAKANKKDVTLAAQKRLGALKKRSKGPSKSRSTTPKREETLKRRMARIASAALSYRGTPYVWGGDSPKAFDCSGFTQYLYKTQYGINLPHNAKMQFKKGTPVSLAEAEAGDLVFFNTRGPLTHVGMYLGNGKFVHAANPRRGVRVDNLSSGYYRKCFAGARSYR